MGHYRKKPIEIEAVRYNGDNSYDGYAAWLSDATSEGVVRFYLDPPRLIVKTLEGDMLANPGDWIIRGVEGEIYPCKPSVFATSYEPA